jgi:hypothetical protein
VLRAELQKLLQVPIQHAGAYKSCPRLKRLARLHQRTQLPRGAAISVELD